MSATTSDDGISNMLAALGLDNTQPDDQYPQETPIDQDELASRLSQVNITSGIDASPLDMLRSAVDTDVLSDNEMHAFVAMTLNAKLYSTHSNAEAQYLGSAHNIAQIDDHHLHAVESYQARAIRQTLHRAAEVQYQSEDEFYEEMDRVRTLLISVLALQNGNHWGRLARVAYSEANVVVEEGVEICKAERLSVPVGEQVSSRCTRRNILATGSPFIVY